MDAIRRIGQPTFERTGGGRDERVSVRFKLNREPDMTWVDCFKSHAASSALGGAHARFRGKEGCIEGGKPARVPAGAAGVGCFLSGAHLQAPALRGRGAGRRGGRWFPQRVPEPPASVLPGAGPPTTGQPRPPPARGGPAASARQARRGRPRSPPPPPLRFGPAQGVFSTSASGGRSV